MDMGIDQSIAHSWNTFVDMEGNEAFRLWARGILHEQIHGEDGQGSSQFEYVKQRAMQESCASDRETPSDRTSISVPRRLESERPPEHLEME